MVIEKGPGHQKRQPQRSLPHSAQTVLMLSRVRQPRAPGGGAPCGVSVEWGPGVGRPGVPTLPRKGKNTALHTVIEHVHRHQSAERSGLGLEFQPARRPDTVAVPRTLLKYGL